MQKFLIKLEKSVEFWFLLGTAVIFFLLRFPSFFEPYWYGDEGIYEVLGYAMRHGRMLYQGIWDNKPPMLYLIYALFDGSQPYVRVFSFIVGLAAIVIFFFLAKLLFQNKKSVFAATGFFTLFLGLPLVEGNIANAENFMVLPTVGAAFLIVRMAKKKKYNLVLLFLSGVFLGISFLIKVVAVFDFSAFFLFIGFLLFAWNKKTGKEMAVKIGSFFVGFFLPLFLTILFFASKGLLTTFVQSAFLSNVGYVNYANQFFIPFTKINIPQGYLLLRLLLLGIIALFLFKKKKTLSLEELFIYLWISFSLFSALFSGRPYTHYMLVLLGAISLLTGLFFAKKTKIASIIIFILICITLARTFSFYNKTFPYYANFAAFLVGQKSVQQYQTFFDSGVPRDYDVAEYLKERLGPKQQVFLWTNSAQIYRLMDRLPLGRYTVAYHMTASSNTLSETGVVLEKIKPQFIVILPNASLFPFLMSDYTLRVSIHDALIYEKVF